MRDDIKKQVININLPDMTDDDFFIPRGKEFLNMLYEVESLLDGEDKESGVDAIINKMLELYDELYSNDKE